MTRSRKETVSKVKIVIVEKPYEIYQESLFAREFMSKLWKLKLDGYSKKHKYGVLPIGRDDWFSNHIVVCLEEADDLNPIMAFKSTTSDICVRFNDDFPIIPSFFKNKEGHYPDHILAIKSWIAERRVSGDHFAYNSSYTICPEIKFDSELLQVVRELTYATFYSYYTGYNISHVIATASAKFKMHLVKEKAGFDYIKLEGREIPSFNSSTYSEDDYYVMHVSDQMYSDFIKSISKKYEELWSERLTLTARDSFSELNQVS